MIKSKKWDVARYALLIFISLLFLFPLVWIILTSLKSEVEVRSSTDILPHSWLWRNYIDAWKSTNFTRQFLNSMVMAVSVTCGQIFTSALAGYAFARLKFMGRSAMFSLTLATLVIPYQLLVLPIFIMFNHIGWIDTYAALIVPSLSNAFGIFLFKQHFETIPMSIEEAAKIDGASRWCTLWRVVLPLSKAPAVTLFLLTFIAEWNDLFKPLVFTSSEEMRTVQLGLTTFQEQFSTNYTLLMAAVVFVTLPVLLMFFIGQKQFIEGIANTGGKE
ncbi:MAG: carbohydrate ABC transporter permease [Spartobacteria bacterium]|nr:carbohydrate ABC transporter permease [Spartobacteria bacterium]